MYAVIMAGGKQHRVEEGENLRVDLLPGKKKGESLEYDVLMLKSGDDYKVGAPRVDGAKVQATVLRNGDDDGDGEKAKKILVYKKKRRKGYERMQGHRQRYTEVRIDKIVG
jgi:large subunit ribosomal protein L21